MAERMKLAAFISLRENKDKAHLRLLGVLLGRAVRLKANVSFNRKETPEVENDSERVMQRVEVWEELILCMRGKICDLLLPACLSPRN